MKHFIKFHCFATILIAFVVVLLSSCNDDPLGENKNNPPTVSLPAAEFSVIQYDYEHGFHPDSNYVFESILEKDGSFRYGLDKLDKLVPNIFPDEENRIEFVITSEDPSFKGVNASSSAQCVNIVSDGSDNSRFHLEWNGEGYSTITFWNGDGETKKGVSFMVTSYKEIPMTGLLIRYNHVAYSNFFCLRMYKYNKTEPGKSEMEISGSDSPVRVKSAFVYKDNELPVIEIVGPIPLNANVGPEDVYDRQLVLAFSYDPQYKLDDYSKYHDNVEVVPTWERNIADYSGFSWLPSDTYEDESHSGAYQSTKKNWYDTRARKIRPCDLRDRRIKYLYSGLEMRIATGQLYYYHETIDPFGQVVQDGFPDVKHVLWEVSLQGGN